MNQRDKILTTAALLLILLGLAVIHANWSLAPMP